MDYSKIGETIKKLRTKDNMTQRNVAERLYITEQAVSKWERGLGLPDIETLACLADVLNVNVETILFGDLKENEERSINLKNLKFYICPVCGNVITSTSDAEVHCCGRNVAPQKIEKATDDEKMKVERIEDHWYITSDHPMTKEDYISFTAFCTGERMEVVRHFPEWNLEVRIPAYMHGKFIWYSKATGLKYQLI